MQAKEYFLTLKDVLFESILTYETNKELHYNDAIELMRSEINKTKEKKGKLIFIGNGGSAGIASHCTIDYWKNGRIPSICFNEGALLTCISNDFGFKSVFEKPLEMFADEDDLLVAISSSGQSENILNGAKMAKLKKCRILTLSGFNKNNPLRRMGDLNFYVPSESYGYVELAHQIVLHTVLDLILDSANLESLG